MQKRKFFLFQFIFLFSAFLSFGQQKSVVITGYAPSYLGKTVELFRYEDYLTMTEELVATTIVGKDSTFQFEFPVKETEKFIIKSNKNKAFLYVQSGGKYDVYLPEKDKYDPFRPSGNVVELTFWGLDSTDINYKILGFNRWVDAFIGEYYYKKNSRPLDFLRELDSLKQNVEKNYKDDTSSFFKTYVKFTFASLDEIQSSGSRNKYEKHDFYLKHSPVSYRNDVYMQYLIKFYDNLMPRLNTTISSKVNIGIEKESPTLIMKALGGEYTLINLRIREFVMIKMLTEEYYKGNEYKGHILKILDSLSNNAMFNVHEKIAKNTIFRLQELIPGNSAPDFALKTADGTLKNIANYSGKHLYLHFYNPYSESCKNEIPVLTKLYESYKEDVVFITFYTTETPLDQKALITLNSIPWEKYELKENDPVVKSYKIENYPSYILIDQIGHIVSAPALGPLPNGLYETIEKTFFFIHDYNSKRH